MPVPKIEKDELGLWMPDGWERAIRPAGFSRFKEGAEPAVHHFGGSALRGVGKKEGFGRGEYQEIWLSAPSSKMVHEKEADLRKKQGRENQGADFEFEWDCYLRDLAVFWRANPDYDPMALSQKALKLKARREKLMGQMSCGKGILWNQELLEEGRNLAAAFASANENADLKVELGEGKEKEGSAKPKRRI